jgi:hypothetical protein
MLAGVGIIKATRYAAAHHLNLPEPVCDASMTARVLAIPIPGLTPSWAGDCVGRWTRATCRQAVNHCAGIGDPFGIPVRETNTHGTEAFCINS